MNITEIELVGDQDFSIEKIEQYLLLSTPHGGTLDGFNVNYMEQGDQRLIILTDTFQNIAAFAMFHIWNNGKVWQARNCQSYPPYTNQKLVGKIYKLIINVFHKSLQSDTEQSFGGRHLWTNVLPSLGLAPMIFDTKTERILNPNSINDVSELMYPEVTDPNDPLQWRYTWILEHRDHYPSQNLLAEGSLIFPLTGLWKK